jgi:internalin A
VVARHLTTRWSEPRAGLFGSRKAEAVERNCIFFSYSHHDRKWLDAFNTMLKPAIRSAEIHTWDDTCIEPGRLWKQEIEMALAAARIGVLLVTDHFLESDFISKHELPPLLEAARREGMILMWVYVSACMYKYTDIADYQAAHDIRTPLDCMTRKRCDLIRLEICDRIVTEYKNFHSGT